MAPNTPRNYLIGVEVTDLLLLLFTCFVVRWQPLNCRIYGLRFDNGSEFLAFGLGMSCGVGVSLRRDDVISDPNTRVYGIRSPTTTTRMVFWDLSP